MKVSAKIKISMTNRLGEIEFDVEIPADKVNLAADMGSAFVEKLLKYFTLEEIAGILVYSAVPVRETIIDLQNKGRS